MKKVLRQWYAPTSEELAEFYKHGTIALDANVLLSLYRVSGSQRSQILAVLGKIGDRLWIPFQVAYEYQKNRLRVAWDVNVNFDAIEAMPESVMSSITDAVQKALGDCSSKAGLRVRDREMRETIQRHFKEAQNDLVALAEKHRVKLEAEFKAIRSAHTIRFDDVRFNDPVRDALDALIDESNMGTPLSVEEGKKRRSIAQVRMESEVPPGYKDFEEKADPLGDCLIWFELIEYAKTTNRRILFVTDDVKEDFYVKLHGKTLGPRIEMVMEMAEKSGQPYHQTTLEGFLRSANTYLDAEVAEETISTVRSAREHINSQMLDFGPIDRVETTPISEQTDLSAVEYELLLTFVQKVEAGVGEDAETSRVLGMLGSATAAAEARGDIETLKRVLNIHFGIGSNLSTVLNTQVSIARTLLKDQRPADATAYLEGAYADARRARSARRFEVGRLLADALVKSGQREAGRRVLAEVIRDIEENPAINSRLAANEGRRSSELYRTIFGKDLQAVTESE
ncbi:PIN domain-containing protein [Nocardia sp. NPDC004654]|uniref:PIN-like domain-containing protein n=1 Tax=Nocardia sp. NPDC004654 TaxID=3154776 RepID=UPI0033AE6F0E